jgi:hypothetical protein
MGNLYASAASISFFGDDLDPAEITRRLGAEPTIGVRKGGLRATAIGIGNPARTGSWVLKADRRSPADLDGQINDLLARLTNDIQTWQSLAARYRGRVFCGLFLGGANEGLRLLPDTLVRVGERGLLMDAEIYEQDLPD